MHFMVVTGQGKGWDHTKSMREQPGWDRHATFMDSLAEEGFVVLGGPLGDASRALLIIQASSEEVVRSKLSQDPWADLRPIESLEAWDVLLGELPPGP